MPVLPRLGTGERLYFLVINDSPRNQNLPRRIQHSPQARPDRVVGVTLGAAIDGFGRAGSGPAWRQARAKRSGGEMSDRDNIPQWIEETVANVFRQVVQNQPTLKAVIHRNWLAAGSPPPPEPKPVDLQSLRYIGQHGGRDGKVILQAADELERLRAKE